MSTVWLIKNINSALAMDLSETDDLISGGKAANLFITKKISSYEYLPYAFGSDLIDTIILKGEVITHFMK